MPDDCVYCWKEEGDQFRKLDFISGVIILDTFVRTLDPNSFDAIRLILIFIIGFIRLE